MTFKVNAVTLAASDTVVYETPAGVEGAMHGLVLSNTTGGEVGLNLKFFDASAGTTSTVLSNYSLAAGAQFTWPKPINLNAGDKVIGSGLGVVALQSTFISEATIARSFSHKGEWAGGFSAAINDVYSLNGSSYVSLVDGNTATPPGAGWGLFAQKGATGNSVTSIVKTAGTGAAGTTDTYTITLANGATTTFSVYNGADGGVTLGTAQTLTNKTFTGYTETVYNLAGTAIAVANGSIQTKTLSANTTFTESLADGQSVILGITAGAFSVTWPSVTWAKVGGSGTAPTLTSSGVNWIILWQVGGVVRGAFLGTA